MASLSDYGSRSMVGQSMAICKENRQNCKGKQRAAGRGQTPGTTASRGAGATGGEGEAVTAALDA
jgi:hypothetical protein